MKNLRCIRHSKYDGTKPPVLSCKTCCTIFINAVKNNRGEAEDIALDTETNKSEPKKQAKSGMFSSFFPPLV